MKIEIEIPVADLKRALPGFSKIIEKRTTLPILGCVKVSLDDHDELLTIEATNLEETVQYRLSNSASGLSGTIILPLEELAKVTKACSGKDSIRLVADGKRTVIRYPLGGGFVEQPVEAMDVKEWPPLTLVNSTPVPLSDEFKETLHQAIACAGTDSSRPVINGACLDVSYPTGHYVVGTDGRHLFSANTFNFALNTSVLIPSKRFLDWPGFMEDGNWFLRTEQKEKIPWMRIDSVHWSYIAKQIDGNYPNWKQVVPTINGDWTQLAFELRAVEMMLGAIPLLPGGKDLNEPIDLIIGLGGLTVRGRDKTGRKSEAAIEGVRITGKAVEVSVNRTYFMKALRFGFRELNIENPVSPLVFINGGKTMVVMPLRGEAAEKWYAEHPPENSPSAGATAETPKAESSNPPEGEERKTMDTTMQPPQRGNLKAHNPTTTETSAIEELLEQVEKTKEDLRGVFNGLNEMERLLKKAVKEKKTTEKEVEKVRTHLRSLQSAVI